MSDILFKAATIELHSLNIAQLNHVQHNTWCAELLNCDFHHDIIGCVSFKVSNKSTFDEWVSWIESQNIERNNMKIVVEYINPEI